MLLDHHTITEIHKHRLAECERRAYYRHTHDFRLRPAQRLANRTGWLLVRLGQRLTSYGYDTTTTLMAGR